MKKRILALALAGTTAFSVFGAAMSANAAFWNEDSSHINANDDAYYKRYTAAGDIHWSLDEGSIRAAFISFNGKEGDYDLTPVDIYTIRKPETTVITNAGNANGQKLTTIAQNTTLYIPEDQIDDFAGDENYYDIKEVTELPGYEETLDDYMETVHDYEVANVKKDGTNAYIVGSDDKEYHLYQDSETGQYFAYTEDSAPEGNLQPVSYVKGASVYYKELSNGSVIANDVQYYEGTVNGSLANFLESDRDGYYIAELVDAGQEEGTNYFKYG